jgi:site-specific DNA recombinase
MDLKVALYVRVSTERQAQQQTSDDQVRRLLAYAQERGWSVTEGAIYRDEGYSGTQLNRPALDRLRDAVAQGAIDTILLTSPDRLARRYAYQVWLLEAFEQAGCTVIFLDRPLRDDPQDALLLQIRGAVAEYERTLIADRMRRGRLAKLQSGQLLPWARAPYGFRLDPQHPRDPTGVRVDEEEAVVVRQIFTWYVEEGLSLRAVGRRLMSSHIPSPSGQEHWNTSSVRKLLTNHAYRGIAYGNQQETVPAKRRRPLLKPASADGTGTSARRRAREEWIGVAVPAVIDADLFERAQEQVTRNRDRSPRNTRGEYLLRRVVSCRRCSLAHRIWTNGRSAFYTCPGTSGDPLRGQSEACHAPRIATHRLDAVVWDDLCRVLTDPTILVESLRRVQHGWLGDGPEFSRRQAVQRRESELRRQIDRLVDAYAVGAVSLEDLQTRRARLDARVAEVQREAAALAAACQHDERLEALAARLETFRAALARGLDTADFARRRELVELLIERVVVDAPSIEIRYILPVGGVPSPEGELRSHHSTDVGRIDSLMDDRPLLRREVAATTRPRLALRMGTVSPVDEGAGVGGVVHDLIDDGLRRGLPAQLARFGSPGLTARHEDAVVPQAAKYLLAAAQLSKPRKDELKGALHLQIRIFGDLTVREPNEARRHLVAILTALDPAHPAFLQPQLQEVQLCLAQHPSQSQEETIVVLAGIVHAIGIPDQDAAQHGQIEEAIPVGVGAG